MWLAGFAGPGAAKLPAQTTSKPTVIAEQRVVSVKPAERKVPLLTAPLRLEDFAGMTPRAALKDQLTEISGFTQEQPSNGQPPSEQTEVWMGHTATALYAVFVCHDRRPAEIRRHLSRRENVLSDDTVTLLLDPFADRRHGVLFQLNATGVQADAAWTEGSNPDYSYDQVWNSEARVTAGGWMALMEVPFQSLRFPQSSAAWGVVASRSLPRASETDTWPAISSNISGTLSQEGTLLGIEAAVHSHNIQLNPYGLAQNEHTLNSQNPFQPYFSSRRLAGTAGGDAKVIIKDALVLDATINPDFSQVESDQPQFTVNQRYPVFFPELRPFFLENASFFSTPINLVYTRNIVHPEFGARATGKIGRTNVGVLAIDDRQPGEGARAGDPLYQKRAHYAIARVSEDLGANSSVGAIYTDHELAGSWNRVGGVDFNARLTDKLTLSGEAVESSTKGLAGSYSAGPASKLTFERDAKAFSFTETYRDYAQGFQSQAGFIQTTAFRQSDTHFDYTFFPEHSKLQRFGFEGSSQVAFDRQGNRLYHYTTVDPFFTLARETVLAPLFGENSDTLTPAAYPLLTAPRNLTENFVGGVFKSQPLPQLSFNIVATYGGNPNYNPVATAKPSLLHENFVQAFVTVQPIGQLTIDNTYLLDRNFSGASGAFTFENQTLRTKMNYQFTRALSARVVVEYDSLLVNPLETSLVRTKQVATQALITWLPHPGTAIYVGYNNDLQNLNHGLCTKLPAGAGCDPGQPILPTGPGYLNSGRQFFAKASYLLRF